MEKVKKAIILANVTALVLVIIKVVTWIISWSLAVLASALDSLLDFFISLFNLYILNRSSSQVDENYNYWHGKIQWIGAVLEWAIVWFSWMMLIYFAIQKIIEKKWISDIDISIYVMIVSIIITGFLVFYLAKVGKETNHLTLKADILHYKTDLFTNVWIIVSLILIKITGFYILDAVISIMIWAYILLSSKEIVLEGFHMLMDRKIDDEMITQITHIIENADKRITGYHYLKTRKSWNDIFVDFHLVFDKEIKLLDAHSVWDKIEFQIKSIIPNAQINIHLDPFDDSNRDFCKI